MALTPVAKVTIGIGFAAVAYFGINAAKEHGYLGKKTTESVVPNKVELAKAQEVAAPTKGSVAVALPSATPANLPGPCINEDFWTWNAGLGVVHANGGKETTVGSLMAKRGVCLHLKLVDDGGENQNHLMKFAQELSEGKAQPTNGAHFVGIMADGAGPFMYTLEGMLAPFGQKAKIITSFGKSAGEDKFMGPPKCANAQTKAEKQANCKGILVAVVVRDGDWNIVVKFAGDWEIPLNTDLTTYDPDAINFVNAPSFIDAGDKFNANYCESRKDVKKGRLTGESHDRCVDSVSTWSPVDGTIVHGKRGGIITIASTKVYSTQMPFALIGIDSWMKANRKLVVNYLAAALEGGNQIQASEDVLNNTARLAVQVYGGTETAATWKKLYLGYRDRDIQGNMVELGGSQVFNLAQALAIFGITPGYSNAFADTYTNFGSKVVQLYPKDVPHIPSASEAIDTSYLEELARNEPPAAPVEPIAYVPPSALSEATGSKTWRINFETGKATFSKGAEVQLEEMRRGLVIAMNTVFKIQGHTDNTGNPEVNMQLSKARAEAVKHWLQAKAPRDFPDSRITIDPQGSNMPVASNSSSAGRAQNRRVELVSFKNAE